MREAEITESGAVIGGRSISNLRYADDTALCGKSPQEINNIVHKVNDAARIRLLKLNARKTKLMVVLYCIVLIALSRCNRVFTRRLRLCHSHTVHRREVRKGDREGPNRVESEV